MSRFRMPRRDPADRTPQECWHDALMEKRVSYINRKDMPMQDTDGRLARRLAELDGDDAAEGDRAALEAAVADWAAEHDQDDEHQGAA